MSIANQVEQAFPKYAVFPDHGAEAETGVEALRAVIDRKFVSAVGLAARVSCILAAQNVDELVEEVRQPVHDLDEHCSCGIDGASHPLSPIANERSSLCCELVRERLPGQ